MIRAGQSTTATVEDGYEVTIRRPDGTLETVRGSGYRSIDDAVFAKIKAATAAAGRGEVLSYCNLRKSVIYTYDMTDEINDREAAIERVSRTGRP